MQAKNCYGFYISPAAHLYVINNFVSWEINVGHWYMIPPGEMVKFLGANTGFWKGIRKGFGEENVNDWLEKIGKA